MGQGRKGSVGSPSEWRACTRGKERGTFSVLHLRNLRGSSLQATRISITRLHVGSSRGDVHPDPPVEWYARPSRGIMDHTKLSHECVPHGLSRPSFRKRRDQVFIVIVDAPNDSIARYEIT